MMPWKPPYECGPEVDLIAADSIRPEPIDWIWRNHLAAGKMTILGGAPGTGKTMLALKIAATISTGGEWPDGTKSEKGGVVFWSGEDDPKDTLVPRLIAAGANLSWVHFIGGVRADGEIRAFDPAKDMAALTARLLQVPDFRLLIVDPIVSAVSGDSHKNAEVRRSLQPLVEAARLASCGLLGITHLSKGTTGREPIERITGSLAFGALARIVLVAAKPKELADGEPAPGILVRAKSNIGSDHGGFQYCLQEKILEGRSDLSASFVEWRGSIAGDARTLMDQAEQNNADRSGAVEEAKQYLKECLEDGPIPAKTVAEGAIATGITKTTLRKAREALGVKSKKDGMKEGWIWELPRRCPRIAEDAPTLREGTFGHLREASDAEAD